MEHRHVIFLEIEKPFLMKCLFFLQANPGSWRDNNFKQDSSLHQKRKEMANLQLPLNQDHEGKKISTAGIQ